MDKSILPIDLTATIIALIFIALILLLKHFNNQIPKLFFSFTEPLKNLSSWKTNYAFLPQYLGYIALSLFLLAFIDPHFYVNKTEDNQNQKQDTHYPTEGIALYFILDRSGSMRETVAMEGGTVSKLDLMKKVTKEFIESRPNDLIGLISFARGAQVVSPLTLDHTVVLNRLQGIGFTKDRDQDGTAMGYAIYKTANLIAATKHFAESLPPNQKPAYEIKSSVMILITDGFPDPNPLDKGKRLRNMDADEAARFAKENGIRLYIINVDPKFSSEEFDPQRHLLERSAEITGGKFYLADSSYSLGQIFTQIDAMEKSLLPVHGQENDDQEYRRVSFYPYLIGLGAIALFLSILLSTTLLRKVP